MSNMVSMHDQTLMFIKTDSYLTQVDGFVSYELLAKEFESYWRAIISMEVTAFLRMTTLEKENQINEQVRIDLLKTIWGNK